jgi:hypothetical protein
MPERLRGFSLDTPRARSRLASAALAALCLVVVTSASASAETGKLTFKPVAPSPAHQETPSAPSRATVLEVQHLFVKLGYPLGAKAFGGFGPRTKGAISYFQRKYKLPVTGLPDKRTLALMRTVAASLSGPGAHAQQTPPKDLVDRVFGDRLPLLALAVALAAVLGLLALNARQRPV